MSLGNRAHRRELVEPRAYRQHRIDAGGVGAFNDGLALGGEIWKIEMAVAVHQHVPSPHPDAASLSTKRGKIPCGAGTFRPGGRDCCKSEKLRASAGTASWSSS